MLDQNLYADGRNQPYYTEAPDIAELMAELLGDVTGKTLLEPAVGRGAFLNHLKGDARVIDAVDIDKPALSFTKERYGSIVNSIHADFIEECLPSGLFSKSTIRNDYDAIISNPPYGLRFTTEYRKTLKEKLGKFYVRESYGLFLRLALERLRPQGRYVFIVPDTFLTSRNHMPLREFLVTDFHPTHMVLFDSKRFGSVQFGYGSFCIIAGDRRKPNGDVLWADLRKSPNASLEKSELAWESQPLDQLVKAIDTGWSPPSRNSASVMDLILGEVAECRTGIYTGDNTKYLGFDPLRLQRRANGHPISWDSQVSLKLPNENERFNGVTGEADYVPLIRGGHREPFEKTFWAIRWDRASIEQYKSDKKARFQNSRYYFREGIALPMVTSGRLTASYMNNSVFDQGVVGVFPKDVRLINFLLIYLNSTYVTKVLKGTINTSANNSAKYISRIPLPQVTEELIELGNSNAHILDLPKSERIVAIDEIIDAITIQNIS